MSRTKLLSQKSFAAFIILILFSFIVSCSQKKDDTTTQQKKDTSTTKMETKNEPKNGEDITVAGEVVDANCYMHMGKEGRGPDHKDCAITCAKAHSPLAILTSDGVLYYPVVNPGKNPNDKLMDYIADNVEVKGKYYAQGKGNNNKGIMIESVKKQ